MQTVCFDDLKCSISGRAQHLVFEPRQLSCGHCVCVKCIRHDPIGIVCSKCCTINQMEPSHEFEFEYNYKNRIIDCLSEASKFAYSQLQMIKDEFQAELSNTLNTKIPNHYQFLVEELDIRVESLKAQLDEARHSLKIKLDESQENLKIYLSNLFEQSKLDNDLAVFQDNIEKNTLSDELLYKFNKKIVSLNDKLIEMKQYAFEVNFEINDDFQIDEQSIGKIRCEFDFLIYKLINKREEHIELGDYPTRMMQMPNGNIVFTSEYMSVLALYDNELNLIHKIEKINNERLRPVGLTVDTNNNIYITTKSDNSVYIFDDMLNEINSIKNKNEKHYHSICTDSCCVYALIRFSNNIDVFDKETSVKTSIIKFDEMIIEIKILNNNACVLHSSSVRFYELPSFQIINNISLHGEIIFVHNNSFCIIDHNENIIFYNSIGLKNRESVKNKHGLAKMNSYCADANVINNSLNICSGRKLRII